MTHATLQWTQGLQMLARADNSPVQTLDEPGAGTGPTPMEMVLMGVAGCTAMDVMSILKKKRSPVTDLWVDITGERAEEHPRRFRRIHIQFSVYGDGVKPADVARAIELSVTRYCAAIASVNARIDYGHRIAPASAAPQPLVDRNDPN